MRKARVKKLVKKYFRWWVHWMGLGYWDVTLGLSDEHAPRENGGFLAGQCEVEWKYLTAYVTIYPKAMKHLDEKGIERVVIHELAHVFLHEMREGDLDHEERVATQLQKAFMWVKGAEK